MAPSGIARSKRTPATSWTTRTTSSTLRARLGCARSRKTPRFGVSKHKNRCFFGAQAPRRLGSERFRPKFTTKTVFQSSPDFLVKFPMSTDRHENKNKSPWARPSRPKKCVFLSAQRPRNANGAHAAQTRTSPLVMPLVPCERICAWGNARIREFAVPVELSFIAKAQRRNSYVFGSFHLRQANDHFVARKRESFWGGLFFRARKREKKFGIFWYFFGIFFVFVLLGFPFFVFRALALFFFWFIFCSTPSKTGNFFSAFWGLQSPKHKKSLFFALKRREGCIVHAFVRILQASPHFKTKSGFLNQVSHVGRPA